MMCVPRSSRSRAATDTTQDPWRRVDEAAQLCRHVARVCVRERPGGKGDRYAHGVGVPNAQARRARRGPDRELASQRPARALLRHARRLVAPQPGLPIRCTSRTFSPVSFLTDGGDTTAYIRASPADPLASHLCHSHHRKVIAAIAVYAPRMTPCDMSSVLPFCFFFLPPVVPTPPFAAVMARSSMSSVTPFASHLFAAAVRSSSSSV